MATNIPSEIVPAARLRFLELDSLRGAAAVLVVIAHVELGPLFWSWSLMDMFFILSSFLLTRIVYKQCVDLRGVLSFYGRRIERIWPLYMLTVSVLLVITLILNHARGSSFDLAVFVRLFTFSQYSEMLFHPAPGYDYIYYARHLWSLAIEEQFYVVLPFAILLLRRWPVAAWLTAIVVVIGLSITQRAANPNFYVLTSHADGFALGGLMAMLYPTLTAHLRQATWILALISLVGLLCLMPYLVSGYAAYGAGGPPLGYQPGPATASTFFWTGIIGLLALYRGSKWLSLMRSPALVHSGHLSYALYLVHYPILRLLPKPLGASIPGMSGLTAELLCLPLIFVIAELLYRTIDRPVQEKRPFKLPPRETAVVG